MHSGEAFIAICRRCGSYICKQCTEDGRFTQCPACRERIAAEEAEQRRFGQLSVGNVLKRSWRVYKEHVGLISLTMLGLAFGLFAPGFVWALLMSMANEPLSIVGITVSVGIVGLFVAGLSLQGALTIAVRLMAGQRADIGLLWSGAARVPALVGHALIVAFIVFLCQVVPFVLLMAIAWQTGGNGGLVMLLAALCSIGLATYIMLGVSFGLAEVGARSDVDAIEALRNGWQMARGARLRIAGCLFVLGLLTAFGTMLFTIGLFFTLGYGLLVYAGMYLALRNKAQLPE